jgi:hypothetical protein
MSKECLSEARYSLREHFVVVGNPVHKSDTGREDTDACIDRRCKTLPGVIDEGCTSDVNRTSYRSVLRVRCNDRYVTDACVAQRIK